MYRHEITSEEVENDLRYLNLLAKTFPTIAAASTEIINLEAILNLPKGTEHFISDLHGEYNAVQHVLKNVSGYVKDIVNGLFGNTVRERAKKDICTLIYYPEEKLKLIKAEETDINDWYLITLHQLVLICQAASSKYTRSKVRKALPPEFAYIIEELLHESSEPNKEQYFNSIIKMIINTGCADDFIITLCELIQRFSIDLLHIVGDIYDRGPGAHLIMDMLCGFREFDIQWGNHDINWIGAAAGNKACVANVLRISLRYGNVATIEDGYGINLLPLATFAMETYKDDPCKLFYPKVVYDEHKQDEKSNLLIAQMQKAITIIQFKLEAQLIDKHPEYEMQDRKLLEFINQSSGMFEYNGTEYTLKDTNFPTLNKDNPYQLTPEEEVLINKLTHSFVSSEKLQRHMRCLFAHGGMYKIYNGNLLFHASIPMNEDETLMEVDVLGRKYKGRALLEAIEKVVRKAFNKDAPTEERQNATDFIWYLWCGKHSPLFDKSKMATFETCFLEDKSLQHEEKGCYYTFREKESACIMILDEFGVQGKIRHIINGHVPVRAATAGESPLKANGTLIVIDGGFSKPFHQTTGIAGYTLIYHSHGLQLVQHDQFTSREEAIKNGSDIKSTTVLTELSASRILVRDTDKGVELTEQIAGLRKLLYAYRAGMIEEAKPIVL